MHRNGHRRKMHPHPAHPQFKLIVMTYTWAIKLPVSDTFSKVVSQRRVTFWLSDNGLPSSRNGWITGLMGSFPARRGRSTAPVGPTNKTNKIIYTTSGRPEAVRCSKFAFEMYSPFQPSLDIGTQSSSLLWAPTTRLNIMFTIKSLSV